MTAPNETAYRPGYSDALVAQLRLLGVVQRPDFREFTTRLLIANHFTETDAGAETMEDIVSRGAPIFWSSECAIPPVEEMPTSLPYPTDFPVLRGFLWFEEPVFNVTDDETMAPDVPIQGLAWATYRPAHDMQFPVIVIPLTRQGPTGFMVFDADPDKAITGQRWMSDSTESAQKIALLFSHCIHFMNQRLVVDLQAHPANHDARKQAKRLGIPAPDILVVQYRKREPSSAYPHSQVADEAQADGRWHYSVQFQVTGHWRLQPCGPGRKTIRRVWVREHLKGPHEAPVVRPRKRLLAVVR